MSVTHTTPGDYSKVIDILSDLVQLDHDAVAAYAAAIERLDDVECTGQLRRFQADHERHIRENGAVIKSLGGTPPEGGDAKKMLTKGKVVLANLAGDRAIMKAMLSNEKETNRKYSDALKSCSDVPKARDVVTRGLDDERTHKRWIEGWLQRQ